MRLMKMIITIFIKYTTLHALLIGYCDFFPKEYFLTFTAWVYGYVWGYGYQMDKKAPVTRPIISSANWVKKNSQLAIAAVNCDIVGHWAEHGTGSAS